MIRVWLFGALFGMSVGCRPELRIIRPEIVHIASGDSVLFVATGPIFEPRGDTGLMYEYHSYLALEDTVGLRAQALNLWPQIRPRAETLGSAFVVLHATSRLAAPPAPQPAAVRGYGFVFEKRPDGRWYLLRDSTLVTP